MRATGIALGSQADRVLALLQDWPAIQAVAPYCQIGIGVAVGSSQILHLHTDHIAEICLTRRTICRMYSALVRADQIMLGLNEDWVGVRLDTDRDVDLLIALLSVAIKTHTDPAAPPAATPCSAFACGYPEPLLSAR